MTIFEAKEEHISDIIKIAHATWYSVYSDILSSDQIRYMLEIMYSVKSLNNQIEKLNHHFLLVKNDDEKHLGFASYEINYADEQKTKIHKIYVLPEYQKKGIGKLLLGFISQIAINSSNSILTLNMNKHNSALRFYEKIGFYITKEECIDIGNGFVMDDYILEKQLTNTNR